MTTQTDPAVLPSLDAPYPLSDQQLAFYTENGHIYLPSVLSPAELAVYRPVINDAADRFNTETRPLEERDTYGKAFLQIMNLWARDEAVARFTLAQRFARIAAELMGVEGVRIYHDQALFKEPGGGPTPWHQDQHYWPIDTDNTITMWMPLVDIPAEVGSMTFADTSQKVGYLGDLPISDNSEKMIADLIETNGFKTRTYGGMCAGDATFHAGWTLHGAPGNPTPNVREVMTIIYYADGTRVFEPKNKSQQDDLERWLPGLKDGDLAASELNPMPYSSKI
ncbi:phytanoyl-CoA dioxygenase family protein [bacterium]|nr:MAG: phytanoyl-CoA dioxygenase family protein [bacterium]